MHLEDDINELLLEHDLVIVPRFGGFLASYASARIDDQRKLIHPPDRAVSFNRDLVRDDGLLTDAVANKREVDFIQARELITGEVNRWESDLSKIGRLEVGQIGVFYQDEEKNLQFHPDRGSSHSKASFGLHPVPAIPVVRLNEKLKAEPAVIIPLRYEDEVKVEETPRRNEVMWAAAATAALVLGLCSWLLWQSELRPNGQQWSELWPSTTKVDPMYVERMVPTIVDREQGSVTQAIDFADEETGLRKVNITGDAVNEVVVDLGLPDVAEVPPAVPTSKEVTLLPLRFHVVGGCFAEKANADAFVEDLQHKGYAARQIDLHKGLYRIAYSSHPKRGEALDQLGAVRKAEAPQAWLLIK